jgi:hypothetical protein
MSLALINILFKVDMKQFSTEMQSSLRKIKNVGEQFQKAGAILSIGLTAPVVAFGYESVKAFDESSKAIAQVEAGLKSTGGTVGFTSSQLQQMAADLQKVTTFDDDTILKQSTANLLTFDKIVGQTFVDAQKAALDLSTRFDGDLQSATLQVGKALQDPIKGVTALAKAGVSFSASQKATIKSMVETNNLAGAQSIILKELNKEFGGSAEAAAKAGAGGWQQFRNQLNDLQEDFGKIILDAMEPFRQKLSSIVTAFQNLSPEAKKTIAVIAGIAAVLGPLALGIGTVLTLVPNMIAGFVAIKGAIASLTATIAANPIGAIAVGIALVVGAMVAFNEKQTTLNDLVKKGNENAAEEVGTLDKLYATATNNTIATNERKAAVDKLQALYPSYLKNIDDEAIKSGKAASVINELRDAIFNKARAVAIDNELQNRANERIAQELKIRNNIAATEAEIQRLKKGSNEIVLQEANSIEKTARVTISKSDAIAAQTKLLKIQQSELIKFNADAKKSDEELLKAKEEYSSKTGKLQQNELDKINAIKKANEDSTNVIVNSRKKITAITLSPSGSNGAGDSYDREIANFQKFQDSVANTPQLVAEAKQKIEALQFAKALNLDPSSIIKTSETIEEMNTRLAASSTGVAASLKKISIDTEQFSKNVGESIKNAISSFADGMASAVGAALAGGKNLASSFSGLIFSTLGGLLIQLGKIAIETAIAIGAIKNSLKTLNPVVAFVAGFAAIAIGTAIQSEVSGLGKFANGGIVGGSSFFGDKILARVNSGELILNQSQQKSLYGQLNNPGGAVNVVLGGGFEIDGTKLRLVLDRTDKKLNRLA